MKRDAAGSLRKEGVGRGQRIEKKIGEDFFWRSAGMKAKKKGITGLAGTCELRGLSGTRLSEPRKIGGVKERFGWKCW